MKVRRTGPGISVSLSARDRHTCLVSTSEPSSGDGNSSELEEEEEEVGRGAESQAVPQTPDQEAFLKEHFVTLANQSSSGTTRQP